MVDTWPPRSTSIDGWDGGNSLWMNHMFILVSLYPYLRDVGRNAPSLLDLSSLQHSQALLPGKTFSWRLWCHLSWFFSCIARPSSVPLSSPWPPQVRVPPVSDTALYSGHTSIQPSGLWNTIHAIMVSTFLYLAWCPSSSLSFSWHSAVKSIIHLLAYLYITQVPPLGCKHHDNKALAGLVASAHGSVPSTSEVLINTH